MVAFLTTERTILSIQKDALADMELHIAFSGLCIFTCAIAKRAIRIGDFYRALAGTDWALLNVSLSHLV